VPDPGLQLLGGGAGGQGQDALHQRGLDNLASTGEPDWANAERKEEDGYTWNAEELGLAAR
jgi:hypothetical protein